MLRRKELWALLGILVTLVIVPPVVLAQWGAIQKGMETTRQSTQPQAQSPEGQGPHKVADEKLGGAGLPSTTTLNPR